jgi:hypothetical protein
MPLKHSKFPEKLLLNGKNSSEVKPKENWRKRHNPLIPDQKLDEFKVFVNENNDKTFKELAEKWNGKISSRTIGRAIKRLKIFL